MEITACVMLSISLYRSRRLDADDHRLVLAMVRRTGLQVGPSISALARVLLHHGYEQPAAALLGHLERQSTHLAVVSPILEELRLSHADAMPFIERGAAMGRTEMLDYAAAVLDEIESQGTGGGIPERAS